jgi:hypothetical protein
MTLSSVRRGSAAHGGTIDFDRTSAPESEAMPIMPIDSALVIPSFRAPRLSARPGPHVLTFALLLGAGLMRIPAIPAT